MRVKITKGARKTDLRDILIEDLDLSVRAYNALARSGIKTLGDLQDSANSGFCDIKPKINDEIKEEYREKILEKGLVIMNFEDNTTDIQ